MLPCPTCLHWTQTCMAVKVQWMACTVWQRCYQMSSLQMFYEEARSYNSNTFLDEYLPACKESHRIDLDWWHQVGQLKQYPLLLRLVSAVLSVFFRPSYRKHLQHHGRYHRK
eukprot:TRINITY_DN81361_c0_g1_i1.p1 TRINITY_DN81361_c0_g1~~TRINITY_DN81361_c0_g1_i1.p1  ORF type:complete len:112 (+),score=16.74 TRINITY_DN81361_c0_g1_i1:131-466(+)